MSQLQVNSKHLKRLALWSAGYDDALIAEILQTNRKTIQKWRTRHNLPPNKRPTKNSDPDGVMWKLYKAGCSDSEIAVGAGCSRNTVINWRRKYGLKANSKREYVPEVGVPMEQALTPEQCERMRIFLRALLTYAKKVPPRIRPDVSSFMATWRELCSKGVISW